MTEDVPAEKIQVDFEALLRKAQAVTSEITASDVLPVITGNEIKLGRLIEVNDRLKSTCGELDVKFVDNDTNFTFRNGTVDFATFNRDGIHLSQKGTGRLMTNLSCQSYSDTIRTIAQHWKPSRLTCVAPIRPLIVRLSDGGRCQIQSDGGRCQIQSDCGRCQLPSDGGRCPTYATRLDGVQSVVKLTTLRPRVDTPGKVCAESAVIQATKTNITLVIRTSACRNGPLIYLRTFWVTCISARLR